MPHPKKKQAKGRSARRRAHNAISADAATDCTKCKKPVRPHHACTFCGNYKGVQRLAVK